MLRVVQVNRKIGNITVICLRSLVTYIVYWFGLLMNNTYINGQKKDPRYARSFLKFYTRNNYGPQLAKKKPTFKRVLGLELGYYYMKEWEFPSVYSSCNDRHLARCIDSWTPLLDVWVLVYYALAILEPYTIPESSSTMSFYTQ